MYHFGCKHFRYAKCRALHLAHCLNTGTVPSEPKKIEENGCFSTNASSYLDEEKTFELLPFQAEIAEEASSSGFLNIPKTSYNKNNVPAEKIYGLDDINFGSCASAVGGKRKTSESFCAHPALDEPVKVCEKQGKAHCSFLIKFFKEFFFTSINSIFRTPNENTPTSYHHSFQFS